MIQKFVVYGLPQGKKRPRFKRGGHTYTDPKTTAYERSVLNAWAEQCGGVMFKAAPTSAHITAYFPIPASYSKKRKELLKGKPFLSKPDADNIGKVVLDALNSKAFMDDAQINDLTILKFYVDDTNEFPRVEVVLTGSVGE